MKNNINKTIMQYFEWYLPNDCELWNKITKEAKKLNNNGITDIWLPPAYKAANGKNDVGYAVYDLYDLGEFNQKGSVATKYGTKGEYIKAIEALHQAKINVLADIVLNHRMGADETEKVLATTSSPQNRNEEEQSEPQYIEAWTKYTFPGRADQYSTFKWNWTHFDGIDWDENTDKNAIFKFYGKHWDNDVDHENGNYDYLMGADVDLNNVDVVRELTNWGIWYLNECNLDGFRIDAVKHIRSSFYKDWLKDLSESSGKDLFVVGEYWNRELETLINYINQTDNLMSLFDVPLHYNLFDASTKGSEYDLRTIFDNTLVKQNPEKAVTFVDNHDTQPTQALESWITDWFKPLAYSLILLRTSGIPCVFYGDYYGIPNNNIESKQHYLNTFMKVRKYLAYGQQKDYFDDPNIIGWTLSGLVKYPNSGLAVIMSNKDAGTKVMNIGKNLAKQVLYDCTGNIQESIIIDENGNGEFKVNPNSVSVWIKKDSRIFNTEN